MRPCSGKSRTVGARLHADVPVLAWHSRKRTWGTSSSTVPCGSSALQVAKRQLVGENQRQLAALERTGNGGAADLLPIGPGLLIAHEEVLVIDAGQVKRQPQAIYLSPPHQTGVTERSIGRHDGDAVHHVIDHVVVRHAADGIRARAAGRLRTAITFSSPSSLASRAAVNEGWRERVEHQLVDIDARQKREHDGKHAPAVARTRRHFSGCTRQYPTSASDRRDRGDDGDRPAGIE